MQRLKALRAAASPERMARAERDSDDEKADVFNEAAGRDLTQLPATLALLTQIERETERLVLPVSDSPKPPPRRITLTLPAVRRAREVWLVVSGAAKADAVAAAVNKADPVDIPAAGAVGQEATVWLLDTEAASKLNR